VIRRKCEALLRKGICRLWTNVFVRERPVPFLKPRPADAFRIILCLHFHSRPLQTTGSILSYSYLSARRKHRTPAACPCMFLHRNGSAYKRTASFPASPRKPHRHGAKRYADVGQWGSCDFCMYRLKTCVLSTKRREF